MAVSLALRQEARGRIAEEQLPHHYSKSGVAVPEGLASGSRDWGSCFNGQAREIGGGGSFWVFFMFFLGIFYGFPFGGRASQSVSEAASQSVG